MRGIKVRIGRLPRPHLISGAICVRLPSGADPPLTGLRVNNCSGTFVGMLRRAQWPKTPSDSPEEVLTRLHNEDYSQSCVCNPPPCSGASQHATEALTLRSSASQRPTHRFYSRLMGSFWFGSLDRQFCIPLVNLKGVCLFFHACFTGLYAVEGAVTCSVC